MKPSSLDPERWRRIDEVLGAALHTPPADRPAFLEEACEGDDELRAEVEALLEAHTRADGWFEEPVSPLGAAILASSAEVVPEGGQIGPFRVLGEIGRGGMGVVYEAEDTRLGRKVALKVLPPYLGVGPDARRRFVTEARAVSALDHPNVATLHEIDATDEGQLYMVFAYYEGETLAGRIARGALPPDEAVEVAIQIAEGLAAAHRQGIVHRDVKPSNVLLTEAGPVKLLDFGVAKVAGEDITGAGVQLGTVAFMSPEHARGSELDGRTDLWSLGVVLYEMVAGARPFRGADQVALVQSILQDEPQPLISLRREVSEGLDRVVRKLLSKEPEQRYRSAETLLLDLRALRTGAAPPVSTGEPPPLPRRVPWREWAGRRRIALSLVALAVVAGGVWLVSALGRERTHRLAVLPLENLTGDTAEEYFVHGIHEGLVTELGKISRFRVSSRTSVLRFRDQQTPLPDIARALDVDALVEGSLLREGDSLTLEVRLVSASPEATLWAERYQAGVGRAFDIAGDVARSIAGALDASLSPDEDRRLASTGEVSPQVLDLYYRGRSNLDSRTREGYAQAQRYLNEAIRMDSSFAPAYGLLAEAYGQPAFFGLVDPNPVLPHAKQLIEKGLAIDPTVAEAYSAMAHLWLFWLWDVEGAETAARRAIQLRPSYAPAYWALAEVLSVERRDKEALAMAEQGSELERFTPFSKFRPVVVLQHQRAFEQAIEKALEGEGVDFYREFWQGPWLHCLSLAGAGRLGEAVSQCENAVEISGGTPMALGALGYVLARNGQREAALDVAAQLEAGAAAPGVYVGPSYVAMIYAGMGGADPEMADRAFAWLDRAFEERDVTLIHLADQAFWDPISLDPRFEELLGRMGLEPRVLPG